MSKIKILLFIGVFLCASYTQAQSSQVTDTLELDGITVTASKIPVSLRETTKPAIVIDQSIIARSSGKSISQLLDEQAGLIVNGANSNPGLNKNFYVQGAVSKYTLFLVDGLAVQDPNGLGGASDLRNISLDNVERIEIVKGSMSTLYGTDAISGVVNIITKKAQAEAVQVIGIASYGSYSTYKIGLGVNGSMDGGSYSINFNREKTDGISEAEETIAAGNFDDDGFERNSFNVETTIRPTTGLTITPFVNYSGFKGDYDAGSFTDAANVYESQLVNPGIRANYVHGALAVNAGYNYTGSDYSYTSAFGTSEYDGKLRNFDAFASYAVSSNIKSLVGFNYQNMRIGSQGAVENPNSDIHSPYFTTILTNWNNLSAEAGIRFNNHSEFGNNTTYSISGSYYVFNEAKVFASYGTGFRAPSLLELFGQFGANPNLDPETSTYFNIGLEEYFFDNKLNVSINYFDRKIKDVIVFTTGYVNQDEQKDAGVEISANYIVNPKITVRGNYTNLNGKYIFKVFGYEIFENSRDNLPRRPEHSFGLGVLANPIPELTISLNGNYLGERKDLFFDLTTSTFSEVTLDSYLLVNAYIGYQFMDGSATVFWDMKNLMNADDTEVYGYSTLSFNMNLGIRFNLN